jgi:hypothetical protein
MRTLTAGVLIVAAVAAGCGQAASGAATHGGGPSGPAHPVHAVSLRVGTAAGRAYARVAWWGGVPSCYRLAPVRVSHRGSTIVVALREGSVAPPGTACIDMAMRKSVRVWLGELAPGRYRVVAGGRSAVLRV